MEKAYAKIYGNYEKIENACSGDALRDLTGAYAKEYKKKNETPAEGERIFALVQKNLKSKYVLMTNSDKSDAGFFGYWRFDRIILHVVSPAGGQDNGQCRRQQFFCERFHNGVSNYLFTDEASNDGHISPRSEPSQPIPRPRLS